MIIEQLHDLERRAASGTLNRIPPVHLDVPVTLPPVASTSFYSHPPEHGWYRLIAEIQQRTFYLASLTQAKVHQTSQPSEGGWSVRYTWTFVYPDQ